MHISKLRLLGFKSFVEPTDLIIEHGLTGVVGPNGCGKSNLLEALRWVMGESSYKSMRASAMDDVIFSGTVTRPARNAAEVTIFLDNSARTAPVEFNDADDIEITRRIEREAGSNYRINGREARARDVKILFEDAATGARSPALVRQGQIGEIVNAKPEQRRRILEDAAGIAGLHSRRHEAELRLKAAENNLARIGDLLGSLKSQLESLKRQARQARRYGDLSDQIRQAEAMVLHLTWAGSQAEVTAEEAALQAALHQLGLATQAEAAALRHEAELSEKMQPLREQAMVRAAVATRMRHELETLNAERERIIARRDELGQRAQILAEDRRREVERVDEAERQGSRLAEERATLSDEVGRDSDRDQELDAAIATAETALGEAERIAREAQATLNERLGEERSLKALAVERGERQKRLEAQLARVRGQISDAEKAAPEAYRIEKAQAECAGLVAAIATAEDELAGHDSAVAAALDAEGVARGAREAATIALRALQAEEATLAKFLATNGHAFPSVIDQVSVAPGYEAALAAALGDDIEAATESAAPVYWKAPAETANNEREAADDPALPKGVEALTANVEAPAALHRRLRQIGVVDAGAGAALQSGLKAGQRLVSREGHLWRWDGLVARADAPSAAAQRLAGRNRLSEVAGELAAAAAAVEAAEAAARSAADDLARSRDSMTAARRRLSHDQAALAEAQERLARERQAMQSFETRMTALRASEAEAVEEARALAGALAESEAAVGALPDLSKLEAATNATNETLAQHRTQTSELRAERAVLSQTIKRLNERMSAIAREREQWARHRAEAEARIGQITHDTGALEAERAGLATRPDEIDKRLEELRNSIETAEKERTAAEDAVAAVETGLREATEALRETTAVVTGHREARARTEARLEGARLKRAGIVQKIHDTMETTPEGCLSLAGVASDADLPALADAEGRLARLRTERERLGGVNLQAEHELAELEKQFGALDGEREDVEEAVAKLRAGIQSLNREGRKRLREAFKTVDDHFQALFQTLFDGGEARLSMIESDDDPLAGGLEIIAKPPGKKPTTLSLLSGGEQTLTALSLIFAVFLTNPSPICVLDEVDAPLDDTNVDRFCRMMEKMATETDTRFLVITHHPETMARMDRLFGVTMGEKGVSQLVSVDLERAERFLEAG